jgi:DNA-binding GntR family transcriptional regulator
MSVDDPAPPRSEARNPLYVRIAANIREEILDGALAPGQRLREQVLAERYGVSRVPVRDALRRLEVERLVQVEPNRGAVVTLVTAEEALELLQVRLVLEELIVRHAAQNRTDEQLEELTAIVELGRRSVRGARPADLVGLNTRFHQALGRASHNSTAVGLVDQLRARIELVYAGKLPRRAESSWREHGEILQAISDGDVEEAGARLRDHLLHAAAAWESSVAG